MEVFNLQPIAHRLNCLPVLMFGLSCNDVIYSFHTLEKRKGMVRWSMEKC